MSGSLGEVWGARELVGGWWGEGGREERVSRGERRGGGGRGRRRGGVGGGREGGGGVGGVGGWGGWVGWVGGGGVGVWVWGGGRAWRRRGGVRGWGCEVEVGREGSASRGVGWPGRMRESAYLLFEVGRGQMGGGVCGGRGGRGGEGEGICS